MFFVVFLQTKYALIDEIDIKYIHNYKFDARLEIDRNGDGLKVLAMGHPKTPGATPVPLQNILWFILIFNQQFEIECASEWYVNFYSLQ